MKKLAILLLLFPLTLFGQDATYQKVIYSQKISGVIFEVEGYTHLGTGQKEALLNISSRSSLVASQPPKTDVSIPLAEMDLFLTFFKFLADDMIPNVLPGEASFWTKKLELVGARYDSSTKKWTIGFDVGSTMLFQKDALEFARKTVDILTEAKTKMEEFVN